LLLRRFLLWFITKIFKKFKDLILVYCHQKGGPTNPLNATNVPTCLDSDESFLAQKQVTTLINFGKLSSLTLWSLPDGDFVHTYSTEMSAGARASSFTPIVCNYTSTQMHTTSTKANPFKTEPQKQSLRVCPLSLSF